MGPENSIANKANKTQEYVAKGKFLAPTILVILFWNFTVFQCRPDSPQVKGNQISSIVNLVYELPPLGSQEIRKYQNNVKFGWRHSLGLRLPSRTQTLPIAFKKHAKANTKLFFSCPVLLDYSIQVQIFCPGLQVLKGCIRYIFATILAKIYETNVSVSVK